VDLLVEALIDLRHLLRPAESPAGVQILLKRDVQLGEHRHAHGFALEIGKMLGVFCPPVGHRKRQQVGQIAAKGTAEVCPIVIHQEAVAS